MSKDETKTRPFTDEERMQAIDYLADAIQGVARGAIDGVILVIRFDGGRKTAEICVGEGIGAKCFTKAEFDRAVLANTPTVGVPN